MNMASIGTRIAELRKQKKETSTVTQEALAAAVGVSVQAVSKWENGGAPDAALLSAIADFFGVSIDYLYGREKAKPDIVQLMMLVRQHLAGLADLQPGNGGWLGNTHVMTRDLFELCYGAYGMFMDAGAADYSQPPQGWRPGTARTLEMIAAAVSNHPPITSMLGHQVVDGGRIYLDTHPLPFFMVMPQPQEECGGWASLLATAQQYADLFALLGDVDMMRAVLWLMAQPLAGKQFSAKHLASQVAVTEERAQHILDTMEKRLLVTRQEEAVYVDDVPTPVYAPNHSYSRLLPLLTLARLLALDVPVGGTCGGNGYRWGGSGALV